MGDGSASNDVDDVIITGDFDRRPLCAPDSEERQAFLLRLSDALREESSADAIASRALQMLFEQMRLSRCYIVIYRVEEDIADLPQQVHVDQLPPLPAQVRLSDFPEALRIVSDRTLVIDDVLKMDGLSNDDRANIQALDMRALIAATLRKGENRPLWAIAAVSTCPRVWTQGEVALVEEVAERTWSAVERARVKAALIESEAKYRTLFDRMREGFLLLERIADDPLDYRILAANLAYERQTGLSDPVGRTVRDIAPTAEEALESYRVAEETGQTQNFTTWFQEIDRWFEVEVSGAEQFGQIAVLFRDITDRRRAELALRDSEAQFRALATVGSSATYRMSPDWREMRLDGASFVVDTDGPVIDWLGDYVPPEEQPRVREAIDRAIRTREPYELVHRVFRADGTVGWTHARAIPLFDDAGEVSEWFGSGNDVTARVHADQSFTRMFQASPAPFLVLAPDAPRFTISDVNDAYLAATMTTRDGIVGRGVFDAFPDNPDDPTIQGVSTLRASLERVLVTRQPDTLPHLKYDVARPDGSFEARWWSPVNSAVLDDGGGVEAIIHNANDVTEERRAGIALRESEARFRDIADNIDVVFYVHEIDEQRISYVSPAYERIWEQSAEALKADVRSFMRNINDEDRPLVEAAMQSQLAGGNTDTRYRLVRADGGVRHIHDRAFVTLGHDGQTRRVVGLAEDVTATTETRMQLAANAATFEQMVRENQFGIVVIDSSFRLVQMSEGAKPAFEGIAPLIGRDYAEILKIVWQEPFATEAIGHFRHALETGASYVSPETIESRANIDAIEAYDWRIERVVLPDGSNGVVCYFYNLSERMALEASLGEALADKDMLLREIDHRVRNSLSMVAALLTMQGGMSQSAEVKQALNVASSRLTAVARIHERLYKGRQLGIVEFGTYLEEICRDLRASLQHDRIALALKTVPVDLPVDQAVPLGLITNELVTNAFKHCGGGAATISVELTSDAGKLTLTVADTGVGMPHDYSASARKGLGMQVINLLIKQIGGSLTLPAAGGTATFTAIVPLQPLRGGG